MANLAMVPRRACRCAQNQPHGLGLFFSPEPAEGRCQNPVLKRKLGVECDALFGNGNRRLVVSHPEMGPAEVKIPGCFARRSWIETRGYLHRRQGFVKLPVETEAGAQPVKGIRAFGIERDGALAGFEQKLLCFGRCLGDTLARCGGGQIYDCHAGPGQRPVGVQLLRLFKQSFRLKRRFI